MGKYYKIRTADTDNNDPDKVKYKNVWFGFWGVASTHGFPFVFTSKGNNYAQSIERN